MHLDIKRSFTFSLILRVSGSGIANLDVIKTADWIVDLGPEGGSGGGQIIATGTPEDVAKVKGSHTARFLKDILAKG